MIEADSWIREQREEGGLVHDTLIERGRLEECDIRLFAERVELGRMQLTLDTGTREAEARDILQRFGARNVHRPGYPSTRDDAVLDDSQHALT